MARKARPYIEQDEEERWHPEANDSRDDPWADSDDLTWTNKEYGSWLNRHLAKRDRHIDSQSRNNEPRIKVTRIDDEENQEYEEYEEEGRRGFKSFMKKYG